LATLERNTHGSAKTARERFKRRWFRRETKKKKKKSLKKSRKKERKKEKACLNGGDARGGAGGEGHGQLEGVAPPFAALLRQGVAELLELGQQLALHKGYVFVVPGPQRQKQQTNKRFKMARVSFCGG
jgi:NAD(P)H-dependent flavin oxidoreductase YrpB (nitropropane dioxygenase family)